MSFGEYFKNLRTSKNKTQAEIAEMINKTTMLVCGVEKGKNGPFSDEDLKKISKELDLSEKEKQELFIQAAIAHRGIPEHLFLYMKEAQNAYSLLYILDKKGYKNKDIERLIDELGEK